MFVSFNPVYSYFHDLKALGSENKSQYSNPNLEYP